MKYRFKGSEGNIGPGLLAHMVGVLSHTQKSCGLIPSQGILLSLELNPQLGGT